MDIVRITKVLFIFGLGIAALLSAAIPPASAQDAALDPTRVPPAPMHEQVLMLPGDPTRPVRLEVTVFSPDGAGPFPLALLLHGAAPNGQKPRDMRGYRYTYSAYYFLSRGYAVAMPMMRGFAGSGGRLIDHGCDLAALGFESARDIEAVIGDMQQYPNIDKRRVVLVGQSFGGWNTLATGALHPSDVVGLVNFVGGVRTTGCNRSPEEADQALISDAGKFGSETTVPSIWFYGDNDSIFPVPVWRAMYKQYTQRGGKAELVAFGRFGSDSHQLLSALEGLPLWIGKVDAFLARIGMPSQDIYPQYMPVPAPSPSHFAAVDDINAVPNLSPSGRDSYLHFLAYSIPRAFVLSDDGDSVATSGGFDPLGRALQICRERGITCYPYAIDDEVVWAIPTPSASINDVSAVPYLNRRARRAYEQFLSLPTPRAFIIAPDGAWAAADGPRASMRAMVYCRSQHFYCAIYAVDKTIVWRGPSK